MGHRIDLCAATRRDMELTAEHDGRLVGDIVAEWAAIYGKFTQGAGGERVTIDAIRFIRTVAGRLAGTGILRNPLPLPL